MELDNTMTTKDPTEYLLRKSGANFSAPLSFQLQLV